MASTRTIKNPGIFAGDALTVIPPSPSQGVSYRDAAAGTAAIRDGWPFNKRVESEDFNEILYRLTSLLDLVDRMGVLGWCDTVNYGGGTDAVVRGSNGELYTAIGSSGPAYGGAKDPISNPGFWASFSSLYNPAIPDASLTVKGLTRFATPAEVSTGTSDLIAVTPAGLKSLTTTTTREGIIRLSTSAETIAGAVGNAAVTPSSLATLTANTTRRGLVRTATPADAANDAITDAALTPSALASRVSTTALAGIIRSATNAELLAGTPNVAMTPADFVTRSATQARQGTARYATPTEANNAGVDYAAMSPATLWPLLNLKAGGSGFQFNWAGAAGTPAYVMGGSAPNNLNAYSPSNFFVAYATNAGQAANCFGTSSVGNMWPGSRAFATTYTNSTGRTLMVMVGATSVSGARTQVAFVNGVAVAVATAVQSSSAATMSFIVPPGQTYNVQTPGFMVMENWYEQ